MKEDEKRPQDWVILGGGVGWFAYNDTTRKKHDLKTRKFSEAVEAFEQKFGSYYSSRGKK